MNAPKEYYPVGYDKNFDDNFKTRIDLPTTPFHCGDQRHFPGLYADQDLGCMVSCKLRHLSLGFLKLAILVIPPRAVSRSFKVQQTFALNFS